MKREQLKEYCDAEFENIDAVSIELFSVVKNKKSKYSTAELAAIATFIHNFYNGSLLQKSLFCHPERSEGSCNALILQDSSLRSE